MMDFYISSAKPSSTGNKEAVTQQYMANPQPLQIRCKMPYTKKHMVSFTFKPTLTSGYNLQRQREKTQHSWPGTEHQHSNPTSITLQQGSPTGVPRNFVILKYHHLRTFPLYGGFPSPKTKFLHMSVSLVSSSVSPWFVMLRLTPS
jgi:hypothetical protein